MFGKFLHNYRVRKLFVILRVFPKFLYNLIFAKENVYLVTGERTGSAHSLAASLVRRGYNVYLITGRKKVIERLVAKKIIYTNFDDTELDKLVSFGKKIKVKGVIHGTSEFYLTFVSKLAQKLDLVHLSEEAAELSLDKQKLSMKLEGFDDRFVAYPDKIKEEELQKYKGACFLKPSDGCGSAGVVLFDTPKQAYLYWQENFKNSERKYLIEQKFEGTHYDIQGISFNGKHEVLLLKQNFHLSLVNAQVTNQVFDYNPNIPDFIQNELKKYADRFLNKVGVVNGAFDIEVFYTKDGSIYWLDFANRMGAGHSEHLIEKSTGIKWIDNIVNVLLGFELDLTVRKKSNYLLLFASNKNQQNYLLDKIKSDKKGFSLDYQIESNSMINCTFESSDSTILQNLRKEFLEINND